MSAEITFKRVTGVMQWTSLHDAYCPEKWTKYLHKGQCVYAWIAPNEDSFWACYFDDNGTMKMQSFDDFDKAGEWVQSLHYQNYQDQFGRNGIAHKMQRRAPRIDLEIKPVADFNGYQSDDTNHVFSEGAKPAIFSNFDYLDAI